MAVIEAYRGLDRVNWNLCLHLACTCTCKAPTYYYYLDCTVFSGLTPELQKMSLRRNRPLDRVLEHGGMDQGTSQILRHDRRGNSYTCYTVHCVCIRINTDSLANVVHP